MDTDRMISQISEQIGQGSGSARTKKAPMDPDAKRLVEGFANANALICQCIAAFQAKRLDDARELGRQARDAIGNATNRLAIYVPPDVDLAALTPSQLREERDALDRLSEEIVAGMDPTLSAAGYVANSMDAVALRRERVVAEIARRRQARHQDIGAR